MKKFIAAFAALFLSSPLAFAEHGVIEAPWVCRADEVKFVEAFMIAYEEADGDFNELVPFLQAHDMIDNPGAECVIINMAFGRHSVPVHIEHVFRDAGIMRLNDLELLPMLGVIRTQGGDELPVILTMPVDAIDGSLNSHPAPGEGA